MNMEISDIIGIVFSLLIFVLFVGKSIWDVIYRLLKPAEYAKKEEARQQKLQELLKTLSIDEGLEKKEKKKKAVHQSQPHQPHHKKTHVHKRSVEIPKAIPKQEHYTFSHESAYSLEKSVRPTRAQKLFRKNSLKDAVVFREVFGPPKSFLDDSPIQK